MQRFDLTEVLRRTANSRYNNLVTRSTGKAIRGHIEQELDNGGDGQITVIDFSAVGCIDFSCADEIVAKLLMSHGSARFFLLHGVRSEHREAIDAVLERHGLAVVARDTSGAVQVLGPLPDVARRAFRFLVRAGGADENEVVEHLETNPAQARAALDELRSRRLIHFSSAGYQVPAAI